MGAMRFPESSMRWVRLLLEGTRGQVVFNGGHDSRVFDIPSGCAQGSPLSPLLYVIAAQPLAAKCRQLQREGSVSQHPPAGWLRQHLAATSMQMTPRLHGETVGSVRTLLQRAVEPFCAASGAKLQRSKSKGMTLGAHPPLVGQHAETGVVFVDTRVTPIRHLGVLLSVRGATAFAEQLYQQRLEQHHLQGAAVEQARPYLAGQVRSGQASACLMPGVPCAVCACARPPDGTDPAPH